MAEKSVFCGEPFTGDIVRITGDEHQHLRVSRARPGEPVDVFDGRGTRWRGEVVSVTKKESQIRVSGRTEIAPPSPEIWLAPALIKAAAIELVLEKAVELGVARILPFRASRSNIRERDRDARWSRILVEAAKQSKRYHLPPVEPPRSFDELLDVEAPSRLCFAERTGSGITGALPLSAPVLVAIGPEGGWTDEERSRAAGAGFALVGLGNHILRAETAAIVATGLVAHHLGVF